MTEITNYSGIRALVTGHTGFKGSWLCAWLKQEGAVLAGLALPPASDGQPNLFEAAFIADGMKSFIKDIRDFSAVEDVVSSFQPDIIFHLAAQPLVRRSYRDPLETFSTNVMGTAHILEAARRCPSVRALLCVTTDKCYENKEWVWKYRENDPLGGKDPYSASKAAAEIVAHAYRQSLFPLEGDRIALATARGGNVIGGGDWSEDRLVPDIVRFLNAERPIVLRNPQAIRPWQHVLELVNGYLVLGRHLLGRPESATGAWNFGPDRCNEVTVGHLASRFSAIYEHGTAQIVIVPSELAEANSLKLDITKSVALLPWEPKLDFEQTIDLTSAWYRGFHREGASAADLLSTQLAGFREMIK